MRFYGIRKSVQRERFRYEVTKAFEYVTSLLEPNKNKRETKKEYYRARFKDGPVIKRDNSIPAGKYYIPISLVITDLVAKEDVKSLRIGIDRLIKGHLSHKFYGGGPSLEDLGQWLDSVNRSLGSSDSWLRCGRFDFSRHRVANNHVDYFDLRIRSFSGSYFLLEVTVYLAEERKNQLNNVIGSDYNEKRGSVTDHYVHSPRRCGAKRGITVTHMNSAILKSNHIDNMLIETKWHVMHRLSRFFPLILHGRGVVPPSINLFKTNIHYRDPDAKVFWHSVGIEEHYGQFLSESQKVFFTRWLTNARIRSNCLTYVVNEETHPKSSMYYSFDFQATYELLDSLGVLMRCCVIDALNDVYTSICSTYRNAINRVRVVKKSYRKLLRLRYHFEKDLDLYRRVYSEVDWETIDIDIAALFSLGTGGKRPRILDHTRWTNAIKQAQQRLEEARLSIQRDMERKTAITRHINEHFSESRNFGISLTMLIIAMLTLSLLVFPEWAKKLASVIETTLALLTKAID